MSVAQRRQREPGTVRCPGCWRGDPSFPSRQEAWKAYDQLPAQQVTAYETTRCVLEAGRWHLGLAR